MCTYTGAAAVLLCFLNLYAALRLVPLEYPTIQQGVDAAAAQDTVVLLAGDYVESVGLPCRSMIIAGEYIMSGDTGSITECRWRASAGQRHVIAPGCGFQTSLSFVGISFLGGSTGGGLELTRETVDIRHCVFDSCRAANGAALMISDCNLRVTNCTMNRCHATSSGPVAYLENVRWEFSHSLVDRCSAASPLGALTRLGGQSVYLHDVRVTRCELPQERDLFQLTGIMDTLVLTECVFDSNTFARAFEQADGICIYFGMSSCDFLSNTVRRGILIGSDVEFANVVVEECTFIQNQGTEFLGVSAMFVSRGHFASFFLTRNVFARNIWNDEICLNAYLANTDRVDRNYFIENASVAAAFIPCVTYGSAAIPGLFQMNIFQSNEVQAFLASTTQPPAQLQNNYWGDPSGPYHAELNPSGLGDTLGDNIDFIPWAVDTLFSTPAADAVSSVTYALGYPYPNPFNSSVTIEYAIVREQRVRLDIHDVLGRLVDTLVDEQQSIGAHSVMWNAVNHSTGLYFARLNAGGFAQSVKLLHLK